MRYSISFVISLVLLVATASCGTEPATSADVSFGEMWTRQPADGQGVAAIYGTISNTGGSDISITGASVDLTDRVELHGTLSEDGLMKMRELEEGFVVPAGAELELEPGGLHVMLFDIDPASYPTDVVDVTFTFDSGDPAFASAKVQPIDPDAQPMDHGDMDHGDMDHGDMDHGDMDHDS